MAKASRNGSALPVTIEETADLAELYGEHVCLHLPISNVPEVTWGLHVDTRLTPKQSNALRGIAAGLDRQMAKLANGSRVVSTNDAIKYLLEQAGSAATE